jgi:diguanylate cyclase (GGDEF)-like protein
MISPAEVFTIRARVLILVLLAMTPIVLENLNGLSLGHADRLRLTETAARGMATEGAELYAQTLSAARSLMQAAAVLSPAAGEIDPRTCPKAIEELSRGSEVLDALSIATSEGQIACSTVPTFVGLQIGDREYFKDAIATGNFTVRGIVMSRAFGTPVVPAALPHRGADGRLVSIVVAALNLSWIEVMLSHTLDSRNLAAFIIDRNGNLIASYPKGETPLAPNSVNDDLFKQIVAAHGEAFVAADPVGTIRVFAAAGLGEDAYFVIGIDRAQVMANIDRRATLAYGVISAAVLFAILAAVWGSEPAILRPLRVLAEKAVRYGEGNFALTPTVMAWPPEFVPLNRALEQMAQQLSARERNLVEENRQLDYLAQVDGLTGIANRRSFDARLRAEWAASAINKQTLSLLMIDVDHFKPFNDRYGHTSGDSCLKAIAGCIAGGGLRANDFVARYGGEEFAVILPSIAPEAALEIAERLRRTVFDRGIESTQSPFGRVTISVGVAGLAADEAHDAGALLEAADAALYNAKRRGRNTVSGRTSKLVDILAG